MRNPLLKLLLMTHKIVSELIVHVCDDWRNLKNKRWRTYKEHRWDKANQDPMNVGSSLVGRHRVNAPRLLDLISYIWRIWLYMRIFGRCAQVISILECMSGEYLNGVELSLMSHWHEYVHRAMKGTETPVALNNTDDPIDMESLAMPIWHHPKESLVTNEPSENEG